MKNSLIVVAVIAPQEPVVLARIANTDEARQAITGGGAERFHVGIRGVSGWRPVAPPFRRQCRFNWVTGEWIFDTFFVAAERDTGDGAEFCSLSKSQLGPIFDHFGRIEGRELLNLDQ